MLKHLLLLSLCCAGMNQLRAQRLDSLYFNLYVDSLKKGTFNYINVEGKFSDGSYLPLTSEEVEFSCDTAQFTGNS